MSSHLLRAFTAALALVLVAACGANTRPGSPVPAPPDNASIAPTTTTPTHTPYVPTPEDFELTVQVLEQKCFGSAGCNVTFRIDVGYSGQYMRAGEGPYEIVYNVAGTEDPYVGRFTLMPPDQFTVTEELVQTPPGGTLTATVTQVI